VNDILLYDEHDPNDVNDIALNDEHETFSVSFYFQSMLKGVNAAVHIEVFLAQIHINICDHIFHDEHEQRPIQNVSLIIYVYKCFCCDLCGSELQ
jgi:dTDP-glucose pyrophosphorylase